MFLVKCTQERIESIIFGKIKKCVILLSFCFAYTTHKLEKKCMPFFKFSPLFWGGIHQESRIHLLGSLVAEFWNFALN